MAANLANDQPTKLTNKRSVSDDSGRCYLPDFGSGSAVIALITISQLVALVLTLTRDLFTAGFFFELARTSLLMLWMTLTVACVLTIARPVLDKRSTLLASVIALGLVLVSIALITEAVYLLGRYFEESRLVNSSALFPDQGWEFLARNLSLGALVTIGAFRYFYVTHQWRDNLERAAHSRFSALQARIRPHFLFNSMNTIAALTRSDPVAAEQAVEDLADLFRASLSNPGEPIPLEQELEVARVYQRMEQQRLGARLKVTWHIDQLPLTTRIPSLTIQPLLENAIYHGVEQLTDGGEITVSGQTDGDMVTITVTNPTPVDGSGRSGGNQLALDNIRQRLALVYGHRARLEVSRAAQSFKVLIGFPQTT